MTGHSPKDSSITQHSKVTTEAMYSTFHRIVFPDVGRVSKKSQQIDQTSTALQFGDVVL